MSIDTVNDLPPRVQYVAAAAQTAFDYPFPIFTDADLIVYVDSVLQALSTDYTVSGEGDDTGGTVTFVSALVGDEIVTIERSIAIERNTDFQQNGPLNSTRFNDELDKIFLILQQLGSKIKRALRLPTTAEVTDAETELPVANWANKYMTFDSDGVPTPAALSDETMTQATIGTLLFPQTPAEITNGVTPVNFAYEPGDVRRYGSGTQTALQAALDSGHEVFVDGAAYSLSTSPLTVSSDTVIRCDRNATITQSTAGQPCIQGTDVENVTIIGGTWTGADDTTAIDSGDGGIVYIDNRGAANGNIRIRDATVSTSATAGISVLHADGLWIERCEVSGVREYSILAGRCRNAHVTRNKLRDSAEDGADNTYGVMLTGDDAGGEPSEMCEVSFNTFENFASWDAIMAHDISKLSIIGNHAKNVRIGFDISCAADTNVIDEVIIDGNTIELTSTDNWAAASAAHAGLHIVGRAAAPIRRLVFSNNIIRNAFNMSGATPAASSAAIRIENVTEFVGSNNTVEGIGSDGTTRCGVLLVGAVSKGALSTTSVQGDANGGAIRLAGVTADVLSIVGCPILLDTATDPAVQISASTIGKLSLGHNPTNSTNPLAVTTSTIVYEGEGSFTGTLTGCTTSPTGSVEYSINYEDRTVTLEIPAITGTSNTTAATLTGMPALIRPSETQFGLIVTQDNGTEAISRCSIATDGVIALYNGVSLTFTNSGVKGVSAGTVKYRLL